MKLEDFLKWNLKYFVNFVRDTGKCWIMFAVRLTTARFEIWSSSAGKVVSRLPWALKIRKPAIFTKYYFMKYEEVKSVNQLYLCMILSHGVRTQGRCHLHLRCVTSYINQWTGEVSLKSSAQQLALLGSSVCQHSKEALRSAGKRKYWTKGNELNHFLHKPLG